MDPNELIEAFRWDDKGDGNLAAVLRSRVGDRPTLPQAWSNGDRIHLIVHGIEIVMPAEVWELSMVEVRHAIATRDLVVGGGTNIIGKDARNVRANSDEILGGRIVAEITDALRRHPSAGVTIAGSAAAIDDLAARRRGGH